MINLVQELVRASEKGAKLARAIRAEQQLFSLLVQEKKEEERNKRFVQDFKTLADVLIQEAVRHDLGKKFPSLAPNVHGEESSLFTNSLGESVEVKVCASEEATATLLAQVLDGDLDAAKLLAEQVHQDIDITLDVGGNAADIELPIEELAVWIDPLDSTAEYIHGQDNLAGDSSIASSGLQCVTVLIGVYHLRTGEPLIGVINQPFSTFDSLQKKWSGKYYWGHCYENHKANSLQYPDNSCSASEKVILISGAEVLGLKSALAESYKLVYTPGAGYKQICVALHLADCYLLSKDTTYSWDCCAPHALLRSVGGGVVNFKNLVACELVDLEKFANDVKKCEITYCGNEYTGTGGTRQWCNSGGIVAYRDVRFLFELMCDIQPSCL